MTEISKLKKTQKTVKNAQKLKTETRQKSGPKLDEPEKSC
jgi:hypothetical protein